MIKKAAERVGLNQIKRVLCSRHGSRVAILHDDRVKGLRCLSRKKQKQKKRDV